MSTSQTVVDVLIAAMKDAVLNDHLTQIKLHIDARGNGKLEHCRIIVIPENMKHEWPDHSPLGAGGPERN